MDNITLTENGDKAFLTSGDCNLDFFSRIVRGCDITDIVNTFMKAWTEDQSTAIEILMNMRDPRKGKQEKLIPIIVMVYLKFTIPSKTYDAILKAMLPYGYWKDLLRIHEITTRLKLLDLKTKKMTKQQKILHDKLLTSQAPPTELKMFADQLKIDYDDLQNAKSNNQKISISLAGKWAPSEKSHHDNHPMFSARIIKNIMGISSKEYRVMLTTLREHLNILEMLMATQQYDKIDFSKIPATAMKKMNKAFNRDGNAKGEETEQRIKLHLSYTEFMQKLSKGETKINVTGIQPHELIGHYYGGKNNQIDPLVEEQWKLIMERVKEKGAFKKVTAVVDVSGSMEGIPMQVAIALGLMVADCSEGSFSKQVITFHSRPSWHKITGDTLMEKVNCLARAQWGGSTNLRATFMLILDEALRYQLNPDQMIETLFVFTDMQFDSAFESNSSSTFEDVKLLFEQNGYALPKIIFWNLRSSDSKSLPVLKDEENVALLSGFSAELLNCIIDAKEFTPLTIMLHVLSPYRAPKEVRKCVMSQFPHDISLLSQAVELSNIKKSFK